MLWCSINFIGIIRFKSSLDVEARASSMSALVFSPLGIRVSVKSSNCDANSFATFKYVSMRSSLVVYSPLKWLMTNCESQNMWTQSILSPRAGFIPAIRVSYSPSLLDARKPKQKDCLSISPVGDVSLIPTPEPLFDDEPSTWSCKGETWFLVLLRSFEISIKKSADTWDFAHERSRYSMLYWLNSTSHLASLPD